MQWLTESPGLWIMLCLALYGLACAVELGVRLVRRAGRGDPVTRNLVVLVRNQEEQVEGFVRQLAALLEGHGAHRLECFLLDMASTDQTPAILERLVRQELHMHLVRLPPAQTARALDAILMLCREGVLLLVDLQAPAVGERRLQRLETYWE